MMICRDTVYFGVSDSVIILPEGENYQMQRNLLLRSNVFYEKFPQKKAHVEARVKRYYALWNLAYSYSTKDTTVIIDKSFNASKIYFSQFDGKVIRNISFEDVDMFEGAVEDLSQNAISKVGKLLNDAHFDTRKHVLKNNLRFRENDRLEAWEMSENERLLRQLDYIEDARIVVKQKSFLADSVDIVIITKDRFPLGLHVSADDYDSYYASSYLSNFLGMGDYLETGVSLNLTENRVWGFNAKYLSRNIAGSFIDAGVYRTSDYEKNNYGFRLERPFRTTDMRFGGAFSYDRLEQTRRYTHENTDSLLSSPYKSNIYDVWLGKTFVISPTAERPNISMAARYYNESYTLRPEIKQDSNLIFHDWKVSLASLMIQKVNFFQTTKLGEFGVTEDIPVGYSLKVTTGHSWNEYVNRPYLGSEINTLHVYPKAGLLQIRSEVGGFYYQENAEDTYIKASLNYISHLSNWGAFDYRHILFASCKLLFNERYYSLLNFYDQYMGYIQNNIDAKSFVAIQYKPTFFIPGDILGFKLSASPFATLGYFTKDEHFNGKNQSYADMGLTLRTKNESLIFPTLGADIRYYPRYGEKNNIVTFRIFAQNTKLFENIFSPKPKLIRTY